ncbi:MAG: hypothetical protein ACYCYN_11845 [Solirubrobacteraceae bacterium]
MPSSAPRLATRFDEVAWEEDLARTSETGRAAATQARRDFERNGGVTLAQLRHVDEHGRDGTVLPRCAKVYVPAPAGRFGIVFKLEIEQDRAWWRTSSRSVFAITHHVHAVPRCTSSPTGGCTAGTLDAEPSACVLAQEHRFDLLADV